ncbi:fimbrial protein [Cupriavidus basilensis]|uniref:Type 1 fimbrial protein n=1 Tax=Cupriavidus basilensis TaxID=68895 RepID=A0A643G036_9BURK|nr:fimbrial protein [Cupriavidus basilensis]QOT78052.1 type 1 fimbrial protein [Cupriavidus basilensis]
MPRQHRVVQESAVRCRRAILGIGCTAAFALPVSEALASCSIIARGVGPVEYLEVRLPAWSPSSFDPTVPDGTVLFSEKGTATGPSGDLTCTSLIGTVKYEGKGAPGAFNTYATGVSGIGVRIDGGWTGWWPQQTHVAKEAGYYVGGGDFKVELVKTGPITAGGSLSGEIGTTTAVDHGFVVRRVFINGSLPIRPQVPACRVMTPSISVPLGQIPIRAFKGVGTTTDAQPFEIRLQCSGGNQGTSTRMYFTMTDGTNWSNRSNLLSLSRDAKATGVGIQVLRGTDNSLVSYGPDSSQSNNPNQWFIGQFGNVPVTIPFKARYIQTASTVTPGEAKGYATFTMSYQ